MVSTVKPSWLINILIKNIIYTRELTAFIVGGQNSKKFGILYFFSKPFL